MKEKNKVWFIADLHLGHANVIKYSKRPFSDVHEMNETLIHNYCAGEEIAHKTEIVSRSEDCLWQSL